MAKAVVLTSVHMPDGSTHIGHTLCSKHLAERQDNNTIAVMDGANASHYDWECDDCKAEAACQSR